MPRRSRRPVRIVRRHPHRWHSLTAFLLAPALGVAFVWLLYWWVA